jgi:FHS family Na+ dependent glucose MFS transporter 1
MFPNGIALGRKMFPLAGTTQALFELGAATGAGAGPFLAAAAYKKSRDSAAVPAACAVAGVGAVAAVAVALRANESRKRRDAGGGVGGAKYREGARGGEALRERLLPDANEEDPA